MIDITEAIEVFKKNAPNKKIEGICEWDGKYVFGSRDKKLKDDEVNWDSTAEVVDKTTGEFSTMSVFNIDFMENAKEVKI